MNGYQEASQDFIQDAKGVIGAMDLLRTAIAGGDAGDIKYAKGLVANAAGRYAGTTEAYQRFGVDEMAVTPETALPKRERVAGDLLASALLDLELANALMVAEQSAEKPNEAGAVANLETRIDELNNLTNTLAFPIAKPVSDLSPTARFGLDEVALPLAIAPSADLATAKAKFEERVAETCDTLVSESKKVVQACFKAVKGFDQKEIADAIGMLGKSALEIPQVGKLIAQGLMIAAQAMDKITKLFGAESSAALREKAQKILSLINERVDLMDKFLHHTFGVDDTKQRVRVFLDRSPSQLDKIDAGAKKLAELQTRFAEQMAVLLRIVNGLTIGKRITGFFLPEATTILLFGTFYFLAMDYAVLAGMDFADSVGLLNFVDGIVRISESTLI